MNQKRPLSNGVMLIFKKRYYEKTYFAVANQSSLTKPYFILRYYEEKIITGNTHISATKD